MPQQLDEFTRQYIETALWSSNDESDESGGQPLDKNYGVDDISADTLQSMIDDCTAFQKDHGELIDEHGERSTAGHDFWLTRNGHGAGFWDGDWPDDVGETLTSISELFGEFHLYVGDDGNICH